MATNENNLSDLLPDDWRDLPYYFMFKQGKPFRPQRIVLMPDQPSWISPKN